MSVQLRKEKANGKNPIYFLKSCAYKILARDYVAFGDGGDI